MARTYYVMELIPGYDLAALVNYHKMTPKTLENLTYNYLGDWITPSKSDKVGAELHRKGTRPTRSADSSRPVDWSRSR